MKNIVFSNYDDLENPYYGGGGAMSIHETARRLAKKYKVTIFTGKYLGSKNKRIDGVFYKRIGLVIGGAKFGQIVFQLCLPYYVLTEKFDIWFESFTPPISTTFLQLFTKKPAIGLVHMLSGKDMKRKYKLPFDFFENLGLRTYKHFVVTSKGILEQIEKKNRTSKVTYIPNGINHSNSKSAKKKPQILFMGRIEVNQKGLDLLLKAFKKLIKTNKLSLVIAGDGEKKQIEILKKLIIKENLENFVVLTGKVLGQEKRKLLSESICMVVPSRFETFSLSSLEALANNLPLIHFGIEGLSWVPEGASARVKPFDTTKLAYAIKKVTDSKKLRSELILNGKKYSNKFTWQKNVDQYSKLIEELI